VAALVLVQAQVPPLLITPLGDLDPFYSLPPWAKTCKAKVERDRAEKEIVIVILQ
jgi:hypothetical protein